MRVSDYGFDSNGNRTSHVIGPASPLRGRTWPCLGALDATTAYTVTASYDAQDRVTSYGTCTYTQRANGEWASRTDTATGAVSTYRYDVFGNLREAVLPDTRRVTYDIDGLNRRFRKRIDGVLVQELLYMNQLEPIAELDASGAVVSRFVYAERAHSPSAILRNDKVYKIVTDHLGSVRLVIDIDTQEVVQQLDYDEYGIVVGDTNPGFQPFGFAGGIYDRDTGLVRFGARDYDPISGTWTAKDAVAFETGGLNLYSYVGGDPLNYVDVREPLKCAVARRSPPAGE